MKLSQATNYENTADYTSALTNYTDLSTFLSKVNSYNCLSFSTINVNQKITEMKSSSSEKFYKQAQTYFAQENYDNAISEYRQALKYNNPYKDSIEKIAESYYRMGARCEKQKKFRDSAKNHSSALEAIKGFKDSTEKAASTYYSLGSYFLSKGLFRNAIADFRDCAKINPNYKDVSSKITEAEAGAVTKVAFIRFDNPTGRNIAGASIGDLIFDEIRSKLKQNASEFIRIMDRGEMEAILGEQKLGQMGVTDEYSSFKQLKGVHYLVFGKLSQVYANRPGDRSTNKQVTAQESYKCVQTDRKGKAYETSCSRNVNVGYVEVNKSISLSLTGSLKVLSVGTGEQVVSSNISSKKGDNVLYISGFSRDISDLWIDSKIKELAKTRQELQDEDTLLKDIVSEIAGDMSSRILDKIDRTPVATDPIDLKI